MPGTPAAEPNVRPFRWLTDVHIRGHTGRVVVCPLNVTLELNSGIGTGEVYGAPSESTSR
jgi:hypothetical protein